MDNKENIADLATIYPQISKEGQDSLVNMAQTMLSIQNSGVPSIPDYNDKVQFVAQVFPKVSRQGQEYLEKIAHAMLLIQSPAVSPIPNSGTKGGGKKY